ncbi:sel1 repeat family protein [Vibrio sp. S12_S33]|nr:sel1 repeat family protein [Vibrio sp. S12_S33]
MSMWVKSSVYLSLLLSLITPDVSAGQDVYEVSALSPEKAFETGRLLRAQYKNLESRPYLKHSADNGNSEASFLYAMELANYNTTIRTPPEAREYLLKAARLGSRRAMYQLYTNAHWLKHRDVMYWKSQYYDSLIRLGSTNPSQATYELARYFKNSNQEMYIYYLDKAVGFNHPQALMDKAALIQQGEGVYFMPGERETEARKMYLEAAKTRYIPAMRHYIDILENKGDFQNVYKWRLSALEEGDIVSLAAVTKILLGKGASYRFVARDDIKAKAYLDLYLTAAGSERMASVYSMMEIEEETLRSQMSAEDEYQVKKLVDTYNNMTFYNHDIFWDY